MNAPWKSGIPGNRDPFAAFICDETALDVLRPVVIELGWQPEKCAKGGLRNAVQSLSDRSTIRMFGLAATRSTTSTRWPRSASPAPW